MGGSLARKLTSGGLVAGAGQELAGEAASGCVLIGSQSGRGRRELKVRVGTGGKNSAQEQHGLNGAE